jgi:RNA polymerase sigma-70 factor (ECF subfamily)
MVETYMCASVQPVWITAGNVSGVETSAERDVELAQQGDVSAFERLYRSNCGRVYALCIRMVGNPTLAEELVQDIFVRAWQKLGSFRGESAFSSWLHRLGVNVVLTEQRSRRRRNARIVAVEDPAAHEKPRQRVAGGQRVDLEKAIDTLPPGARQAFVLHDVEGYSHQEVADMCGIAVGTSKAHLHRARKLLRKALLR